MPAMATRNAPAAPHVPVLIEPLVTAMAPVRGRWLDATFGAGGYARALLEAGAGEVIGLDRDPAAIAAGRALEGRSGGRLQLAVARFSALEAQAGGPLDGVIFDLGVSSMQLDRPERGFSFRHDGPLDMRMSGEGPSAADLVNTLPESALADILFHYGEERAARRIARAVAAARAEAAITTTGRLAAIVASCLPPARPGRIHPATRSFQALRIAVNDELGELVAGLEAAERALAPGGWLAVVSFHSLEDRIVKRYLRAASGAGGAGGRRLPGEAAPEAARFTLPRPGELVPDAAEMAANPRARSARARIAQRTAAAARPADHSALGLPAPAGGGAS